MIKWSFSDLGGEQRNSRSVRSKSRYLVQLFFLLWIICPHPTIRLMFPARTPSLLNVLLY